MTHDRTNDEGFDGADDGEDEDGDGLDRERAEEMAREMAAVQARIAQVPASTIVANHAMGLYELAAIHLSQETPKFDEATLAIDALAALLDRLRGRLGPEEETLRQLLSGLQMAFIQQRDRAARA